MHKEEAVIYLHPEVIFCRPFNHPFSYEHNNRTLNININTLNVAKWAKKGTLKKLGANLHHIVHLANMTWQYIGILEATN